MLNYTEDEILKAIEGSAGIISIISKRLDCRWHTAKIYIDKYDSCKCAVKDEVEKNIDRAESVILNALQANDIQTAKWYLMTMGRSRGYLEKYEIEHSGNINIDGKFEIIGIKTNDTDTGKDIRDISEV